MGEQQQSTDGDIKLSADVFPAIYIFIVAAVGTFGSTLAAVSLLLSKTVRQNPSSALMINLLVCLVLLNGVALPLSGLRVLHEQPLPCHGDLISCVLLFALTLVHLHAVSVIAATRVLAMMTPHVYKKATQPRAVAVYLVLIWLYSSLLPVLLAVFGHLKCDSGDQMLTLDCLIKMGVSGPPIIITTFCYLFLYLKVRCKRITNEQQNGDNDRVRLWEDHVTRTVLIIFVIFFVCNVPRFIFHMVPDEHMSASALLIFRSLLMVQFCLDPFVYMIASREYRKATCECLQRLCPRAYQYFQRVCDSFSGQT